MEHPLGAARGLHDRLLALADGGAGSEGGAGAPLQPLVAPRNGAQRAPSHGGLARVASSGAMLPAAMQRVPSNGMLRPIGARAGSPGGDLHMAHDHTREDASMLEVTIAAAAAAASDAAVAAAGGERPAPDHSTEAFESLDYDAIVNTVYMSWLEHTYAPSRRRLLGYSGRTFARWLLCWLLGIVTGALAFVVASSVELICELRMAMLDYLLDTLGRSRLVLAATGLVFGLTNLALALGSTVLVLRVSPQAAGSGLAQIRAYLNGVHIPRVLSSACLVVKTVGTIMAVGSLLVIGPEAPLVHLGAIVGSGLTRGRKVIRVGWPFAPRGESRALSLSWPWVGHFRNDVDRRDFISIGAAAGFSAAFGSPIGGVLYCLEECSTYWSQQLVWRALTSTTVSSITLMLLRAWRAGLAPQVTNLGLLSLQSISAAPLQSGRHMSSLLELLLYAALGAAGGLLGAVWCRAFTFLGRRRPRSARGKLLEMGAISALTSLLLFALPLLVGACVPSGGKKLWASADFGTRFACAAGETDELASLLLTNREMAIKQLISKPENFHGYVLLIAALAFLPLMSLTFGSATPAGIFMPTILIGCSLGGIVGQLLQARLGADKITDGTFALMGAVAMLGGVMRSSISLCVIILEGTGQVQLLVPIIVTTVAARYVGNLLSDGVVELAVELHVPHIPMVVTPSNNRLARYRASEIMASPVICLDRVARVRHVLLVLETTRHNGFPVVGPGGALVGTVLRSQLLALLHNPQTIVVPTEVLSADGAAADGAAADEPRAAFSAAARQPQPLLPPLPPIASDSSLLSAAGAFSPLDPFGLDGGASEGAPSAEPAAPPFATTVSMSATRWTLRRSSTKTRLEEAVVLGMPAFEEDHAIDLSDEMNIGPLIVLPNTPASRVFHLFSNMGLRHLPVVSAAGEIVGMITRHDLHRFQRLIDARHADREDHFGHDGLQGKFA